MTTKYKAGSQVPTKVLSNRLDELSDYVKNGVHLNTTIHTPGQVDCDADLVLAEASKRLVISQQRISTL